MEEYRHLRDGSKLENKLAKDNRSCFACFVEEDSQSPGRADNSSLIPVTQA